MRTELDQTQVAREPFRIQRRQGFTLIELMIAVAIVAILAAIALPTYFGYVAKQKMAGAESDLVSLSMNMENYLQNNTQYPAVAANVGAIQGADGLSSWQPSTASDFNFAISAINNGSTPPTYTLQATGSSNLVSGCVITMTSANSRSLATCPGGMSTW